jgi:hypothetical protein
MRPNWSENAGAAISNVFTLDLDFAPVDFLSAMWRPCGCGIELGRASARRGHKGLDSIRPTMFLEVRNLNEASTCGCDVRQYSGGVGVGVVDVGTVRTIYLVSIARKFSYRRQWENDGGAMAYSNLNISTLSGQHQAMLSSPPLCFEASCPSVDIVHEV